jgi:hypothetical protein
MAGAIFGNGGNIGTGAVTVTGMLRIYLCATSLDGSCRMKRHR